MSATTTSYPQVTANALESARAAQVSDRLMQRIEKYARHPAFESIVEIVAWAMTDDCDVTFGEVATAILEAVESHPHTYGQASEKSGSETE